MYHEMSVSSFFSGFSFLFFFLLKDTGSLKACRRKCVGTDVFETGNRIAVVFIIWYNWCLLLRFIYCIFNIEDYMKGSVDQ